MSRFPWAARIDRAAALASRMPGAAEILSFYQRVLAAQEALHEQLAALESQTLDLDLVKHHFPPFVDRVQRGATPELVARSAEILNGDPDAWLALLESGDDFFAGAFLQPWAEVSCAEPRETACDLTSVCPCCSHRPQLAVLRELQHGARRNLVCSRCSWEWEFRRILCPGCGEQDFQKLPRFQAESFPALQIESCETCKTYLLCADMTKDGNMVPLVDEIAAIALHLWARDQNFRRLHPNLIGF